MTGVTFEAATETYGKRLQILKDIVPRLTHVAVLRALGDTNVNFAMASLERSAPQLEVTLSTFDVKSGNDLELAFAEMKRNQVKGVIVIAGALTYSHGNRIAELSLESRLPSCHGFRETVIAGGLVSLGPDLIEMAGQGATYFDKIVRGTKPADLPVEQPARYEMYVNIKTAKMLGLELPLPFLARADKVIE
jgi:putative ABC transport system substrate-binding protein